MVDYDRIQKECFWDSNITPKEIEKIAQKGDKRELEKLFSKIIYNSSDKLLDLQIFSKEQLRELFDSFKVTYNKKYITKHLIVLKSLLLDENVSIKSLEWEK